MHCASDRAAFAAFPVDTLHDLVGQLVRSELRYQLLFASLAIDKSSHSFLRVHWDVCATA
jgi:hypothetical protein